MRVLLLVSAVAASCGGNPEPADPAAPAHFTVRGRWDDPTRLLYRIDTDGSPVAVARWRRAVERALAAWTETGVIGFAETAAGEQPDVTYAWRRGSHGECEPFGASTAVAHTGPVERGTFVHFDIARVWSEDGETGNSLFYTALHETGHVLGLGHSASPDAVLRTDVTPATRLSRADLDGLHSLYGGGADRDCDLEVRTDDGRVAVVLRGVAPAGITEHALFDTDGDGDDEVLVWRTDRAGNGVLMAYHFAPGPLLSFTYGPVYGMSAPGVPARFARAGDGSRWMACIYPDKVLLRVFDEQGVLQPRPPGELPDGFEAALRSGAVGGPRSTGDLDGDGRREEIAPRTGD